MKKTLIGLVVLSKLAVGCLGVDYDVFSALRIYVENKDAITRTFKLKEDGLDDLALSTGEITLSRLEESEGYANHVLTEHKKEITHETKANMMELKVIVQAFRLWVEEEKKNVK